MKPALIILHGALGCKKQFAEWEKALSDKFDCYSFDFSGHGSKADKETNFCIELFSEELMDFILQNKLKRPTVLGYSMGGYVALYCALQNPEWVGKIMTVATKFEWTIESAKKEAGYLQPILMETKVPKFVAQLKERHRAYWENVVNKTAAMMLSLGEKPLLSYENIGQIKSKTKFCVGENDKMVSDTETFEMFKHAFWGEYCMLPGCGHLPETISVELIKHEVLNFPSA